MPSSQKLQIRLNPTRQECSLDGPLQSLGFLFRYKIEDGRTNMIKAKLYMNVHWMVLYKLQVFCSDMKFKMAATAGLSLTLDLMGKVSQNASSLKPLGQLKPNCPEMIIGRSSTNLCFICRSEIQDGRHRNTQINIEPYGKMFKCLLLRNYKYD